MAQSGTRARTPKSGRAARGRDAVAPKRATAVSKDELRAQLAKLERANATLRAKNKQLKLAASEATDRVADLEREVSRFERRLARASRSARPAPPSEENESEDSSHDPGDAVPPGVAVQEPEALTDEDRKVLDRLNEESSPE